MYVLYAQRTVRETRRHSIFAFPCHVRSVIWLRSHFFRPHFNDEVESRTDNASHQLRQRLLINMVTMKQDHTAVMHMEIGDEDDETDGIMNTSSATNNRRAASPQPRISRAVAMVVGGFALIAACLMILRTTTDHSSTSSDGVPSSESSVSEIDTTTSPSAASASGVRACTLSECFASNCNHEEAPYTCLFHNGGPHGGCNAIVWTPESCTEQCDLTGCDDMDIPDDTPSCADQICTDQWCQDATCTAGDAPFMCTDGSARYGCSEDKLQWTLRTADTTCASCCDVSSC
jgi:hypothetical protein